MLTITTYDYRNLERYGFEKLHCNGNNNGLFQLFFLPFSTCARTKMLTVKNVLVMIQYNQSYLYLILTLALMFFLWQFLARVKKKEICQIKDPFECNMNIKSLGQILFEEQIQIQAWLVYRRTFTFGNFLYNHNESCKNHELTHPNFGLCSTNNGSNLV